MFVIREALPSDLDDVKRLAADFDTVNLPDDERALKKVLTQSRQSFRGDRPVLKREYLFVLEDTERQKVVGTSLVIAQHGTRESPHVYFDVLDDERYSTTLDRHFKHKVLRIGYNFEGPTEIGGLVLDKSLRGDARQFGRQLSFVRFLFIAMHPRRFRDTVIAELLPPLTKDGKSLLWESFGKKFTGMSYIEADFLSKENKEFIRTLFPSQSIHATIFPEKVQRVIGQTGQQTKGVERMLMRIGFRYAHRIDPFDGGPHFEARVDEISLVKKVQKLPVSDDEPLDGSPEALVAVERANGALRFQAVRAPYTVKMGTVDLPQAAKDALALLPTERVSVLPLE
ncbi:MAG: arginine N-succinyltransferase [Deltaproteobacteria bacterium]|nr:arginine N-succinyltransferase [Deltaproteobacteria bacterium]